MTMIRIILILDGTNVLWTRFSGRDRALMVVVPGTPWVVVLHLPMDARSVNNAPWVPVAIPETCCALPCILFTARCCTFFLRRHTTIFSSSLTVLSIYLDCLSFIIQ